MTTGSRPDRRRGDRGLIAAGIIVAIVALLVFAVGLPLGSRVLTSGGERRAGRLELRAESLLASELAQGEPAVLPRPGPVARTRLRLREAARRAVALPAGLPLSLSAALAEAFGNHRTAARRYRALLRLERALGGARGLGTGWWNLAENDERYGFGDSAAACYERSYGLYRLAGDDERAVLALERAGLARSSAQEYDRAAALMGLALRLHGRRGDARGQARARANAGYVWLSAGDYERALPGYLDALERYRALDDGAGDEQYVLGSLSLILALQGEDWFRAQCRELVPDEARVDSLVSEVRAADPAEEDVCFDAASWSDEVMVRYREMAESSRAAGDSSEWATYLGIMGSMWQARQETDSAVACFKQALVLDRAAGYSLQVAYLCWQLGVLYRAGEEHDSALVYGTEALRHYEAAGSGYASESVLWELQLLCRSLGEDGFRQTASSIGMTDGETEALLHRVLAAQEPVPSG